MPEFALDTSGRVASKPPGTVIARYMQWSDLTPFQQGYVEGLLRGFWEGLQKVRHFDTAAKLGFHSLHHETLARIMGDCEAMQSGLLIGKGKDAGREAWAARKGGWKDWGTTPRKDWPPLTPYLNDAGLVCLRDQSASEGSDAAPVEREGSRDEHLQIPFPHKEARDV